jgi:hypothetical protein
MYLFAQHCKSFALRKDWQDKQVVLYFRMQISGSVVSCVFAPAMYI